MPAWYPLAKTLHILGAVLLLGNVVVSGVWAALLWRWQRHDFRPVARAIWWTDVAFTLGGGALLSVAGTLMVLADPTPLAARPFVWHGIWGLAASTAIWLVVLLPAQRTMVVADDAETLRRAYLRWTVWGWLAVAPLLYALWAMVARR
jgi:hypothetical protein